MSTTHVLSLTCADRPGIVHAVTAGVLDVGGNTSMSLHFANVSLVVTTQRAGAKTPHQLRMEAEAQLDQARAELATLYGLLDLSTNAFAARGHP